MNRYRYSDTPAPGGPVAGTAVCVLNGAAGAMRDAAVRQRVETEMRALSIPLIEASAGGADLAGIISDPRVRTVIACGGDGTVNQVVNAMDHRRQRLAVLPGGRGNSVARDLGVGRMGVALARLRTGAETRLDAMSVVLRRNTGAETALMAVHAVAFGVLPDVVRRARRKSRAGAYGYVVSALINRSRAEAFEITVDDKAVPVIPRVGVIALNTRHLSFHRPCKVARPDDGVLNLVLQPSGLVAEKFAEATMIAGFHAVGTRQYPFRALRMVPPVAMALYLDGEIIEDVADVNVRVLPQAIAAL